jgi:uncharacterized damage-inducible protein DinB
MKDHFINMLQYDKFANLQTLDLIGQAPHAEKPVKWMAHLLAAQQIWLKRCKKLPAPTGPLWPDWPASELAPILESNMQEWLQFVRTVDDWHHDISYQNSQGGTFTNKLADIVAHVINHGTHHRAQAGQHLKLAGVEQLPVSDYIIYIRNRKEPV